MSLPYFRKFGWEPWILTVRPDRVDGIYDPLLLKTVPDDVPVVQTDALPTQLTQRFGLGILVGDVCRHWRKQAISFSERTL